MSDKAVFRYIMGLVQALLAAFFTAWMAHFDWSTWVQWRADIPLIVGFAWGVGQVSGFIAGWGQAQRSAKKDY